MVFRDLQKLNDLIELKVARLGFAKNESLQLGRRIGAQIIFLNTPSEEPPNAFEAGSLGYCCPIPTEHSSLVNPRLNRLW